MSSHHYYYSADEFEVASGELITDDDGHIRVVVRKYDMPSSALFGNAQPIKFVPLEDILDPDFDLAIYIPEHVFDIVPMDVMTRGLESLIYFGGMTLHNDGPDAVSRLG